MNVSIACATPASSLVAGHRPATGLQVVDRVSHHDRRAGELQHLEVVQVVADRHDFAGASAPGAPPTRASARPLGAAGLHDVDQRKVAELVLGERRPSNRPATSRRPRSPSNSARIGAQPPVNITCTGSSVRAVLERRLLAHERAVRCEEAAVPRMLPVDGLEDDLAFPGPVEDDRRARAVLAAHAASTSRATARGSSRRISVSPVLRLDDRPVAEDERQRRRQLSKIGRANS